MNLFEQHADLIDVFSRNYSIPKREFPDIWASKNVRLNSDISEYYDPAAAPFFIQPMRRIFDNTKKEICIVAPPGTGKTTLFEAIICYIAANDPGDVLVASQVDDLLKQWLDSRLNPILARCAALADYLPRNSDRQKKLLLLRHMFIAARAANESSFQQISVRWELGDEVWQWNKGLIGYFRKRLHDRWNGRTVLVSQAGYADTEWEVACLEGDQYEYHWVCSCGQRQAFNFDTNLKWSGDEDKAKLNWSVIKETTRLVCPFCNEVYADTPENRRTLSTNAVWTLTAHGEDSTHETYWVPALANFRVSWYTLVREFLMARRSWKFGDREPWFQFVTQRLSRFWKDEHELEDGELKTTSYSWKQYANGEKIDDEVVRFMTVDRQIDHFWVVIRAWREGGSSRLVYFGMVMSKQEKRDIQLAYKVEDRFVFQDSAYEPASVYSECSQYGWFAILGTGETSFQHPKRDLRGRASGFEYKLFSRIRDVAVGKTKCRLILLASERIKDITAYLRDGKSLPWEVPHNVPELYLSQIHGESRRETVEATSKRAVFRWVQIKANHAWDCEYYQTAAALVTGILQT